MGKGRAKRRRERNAARAQAEKRQKVGLPPGPDEGDRAKKGRRKGGGAVGGGELDGLPRRMREMIRLKEFADKQDEADRARAAALARRKSEREAALADGEEAEEGGAGGLGEGGQGEANTEGGEGDSARATAAEEEEEEEEEEAPKRRRHAEDLTGVEEALREMNNKASARGRKREKAKEWKKQKRVRQQEAKATLPRSLAGDDGEPQMPKAAKVRFGETVAQPPEFNLKQRHWDPEQQAARCSGILRKQLQEAADAARREAKLPDVGSMDAQDAALRLQLIEGYRQQRRGGERGGAAPSRAAERRGPATLQSLKKLVAASSGEPAPAQGR